MKWKPNLSRNQQRRERQRQRRKEAEEKGIEGDTASTPDLGGRAVAGAASVSARQDGVRYSHRDKNGHLLNILLTHNAKLVMSINDLHD